jgi:hypothetical protein
VRAALITTNHLGIKMMAASHPRNQKIIKTMIGMEVAKERRIAIQKGIAITRAETAFFVETNFLIENLQLD